MHRNTKPVCNERDSDSKSYKITRIVYEEQLEIADILTNLNKRGK